MRYLITLEGTGGELDRRTAETEEEIREAVLDIAAGCTLAPGDTIRILDTSPDGDLASSPATDMARG